MASDIAQRLERSRAEIDDQSPKSIVIDDPERPDLPIGALLGANGPLFGAAYPAAK